jgi:hypothetical protein
MFWLVVRILIALFAAFVLYVVGTGMIRMFKVPPPPEIEHGELRPVDYQYRCIVCGAEVTMTGAPGDELPEPPRHCREDMVLVSAIDEPET